VPTMKIKDLVPPLQAGLGPFSFLLPGYSFHYYWETGWVVIIRTPDNCEVEPEGRNVGTCRPDGKGKTQVG